jgi:hypothetical protein
MARPAEIIDAICLYFTVASPPTTARKATTTAT